MERIVGQMLDEKFLSSFVNDKTKKEVQQFLQSAMAISAEDIEMMKRFEYTKEAGATRFL